MKKVNARTLQLLVLGWIIDTISISSSNCHHIACRGNLLGMHACMYAALVAEHKVIAEYSANHLVFNFSARCFRKMENRWPKPMFFTDVWILVKRAERGSSQKVLTK